MKMKAFTNHKENGINLVFPNGNSLSTIWGAGSYTENHDWKSPDGDILKSYSTRIEEGSDTCETMPSCSPLVKKLLDAKFPDNENGSVFGHLSFSQWLEMVNILNDNA